MTLPEGSLLPARSDDRGSFLCAFELVACGGMQFSQVVGAVIGQSMALEPGPQVFDWIQIGRIGRKKGNLDVSVECIQIVSH